ncbi:MAG: hypothetical protein JXR58_03620 [Bacteroidales bacterium]|nr:hypothetical protein [Bacteroidales bacterium]
MKTKKIILLASLISVLFSFCEVEDTECVDADYSDCDTWEPFWGELVISLTINEENTLVPVTIYRGKIEENQIIKQCSIRTPTLYYEVPLDEYYTVKAQYKNNGQTIYAIDGDRIYKKSRKYCDSTCWEIKGGYFTLDLKY